MNDSRTFFRVLRDAEGRFRWNGKDIIPSGGKRVEINGEEYNLTPEIQSAFTDTRYSFSNSNNDDESVSTFVFC